METRRTSRTRRWAASLAALLALALAPGCAGEAPEEAFTSLARAAAEGDRDALLAHLTPRSRVLVRGLLAAAPDAHALLLPSSLPEGVSVVAADVRDDRADLLVRRDRGDDEPVPVVMVRVDGRWGFDLVESQRLWSRLRAAQRSPGLGDLDAGTALP